MNADRELAMLLGLHAGDCLGAPLEFGPARYQDDWIREITGGGAYGWEAGSGTDDTDLAVLLLRSLAEHGRFNATDYASKMLEWYGTGPSDIGGTTRRALSRMRRGDQDITQCGDSSEAAQGNGSLMRCAALALLPISEVALWDVVSRQSALTHAHPVCLWTDYGFVMMLRDLLAGKSRQEALKRLVGLTQNEVPELTGRLAEIPSLSWEELTTTGWCVDTLVTAVWGLMRTESFEEALVAVVNRGNDADTLGAICGALAGAHYGQAAIPERWLKVLQRRQEIEGFHATFTSKVTVALP